MFFIIFATDRQSRGGSQWAYHVKPAPSIVTLLMVMRVNDTLISTERHDHAVYVIYREFLNSQTSGGVTSNNVTMYSQTLLTDYTDYTALILQRGVNTEYGDSRPNLAVDCRR